MVSVMSDRNKEVRLEKVEHDFTVLVSSTLKTCSTFPIATGYNKPASVPFESRNFSISEPMRWASVSSRLDIGG